MNELLEIIKIPITSLLSALVIYGLHLQAKKQELTNRIKFLTSLSLFFVIALLLPFIFYIINFFPRFHLDVYIHEIIISLLIVVPVVVLWGILNRLIQIILLSAQLKRLSLIEQLDLQGAIFTALDQAIINDEEAEKAKALRSLRKWIVQGNEVGWYEIKEQVAIKPIDTQARWLVSKELSLVQREKVESSTITHNPDYAKRLTSLVASDSVGEVWRKWDSNLVADEVAQEALELNAFKKWVWENDETGWLSLQYIREDKGSLSPRVTKYAEFELWEIGKKKKQDEKFDILKEKRLKDLVFA